MFSKIILRLIIVLIIIGFILSVFAQLCIIIIHNKYYYYYVFFLLGLGYLYLMTKSTDQLEEKKQLRKERRLARKAKRQ